MRLSIALLLCCASVATAQTNHLGDEGFSAFTKGESAGVEISANGILTPGPNLQEIAFLEGARVHAAVRDSEDILVATSSPGTVVRISPDGETETLFESEEYLIQALAVGPDGSVFAASSPDGRIYRLTDEGRPEVFFDPSATYIWELQVHGDTLYVTTGLPAQLYRVPLNEVPEEAPTVFWKAPADHLTALAVAEDGAIFLGASNPGQVYEVSPEANAEILYSAKVDEINELTLKDDGSIAFLTFSSKGGNGESAAAVQTTGDPNMPYTVTVSASSNGGGGGNGGSSSQAGTPGKGSSALIERLADGTFETLWDGEALFSILPSEDGWIAGSGEKGRVYEMTASGKWSLLSQAERGGAIVALVPEEQGFTAVSTNPAAIYSSSEEDAKAVYTSQVHDAQDQVRWGELRLVTAGGDEPDREVRVGNTETPNHFWTDWREVAGDEELPVARFLQYRLTWPAGTATEAHSVQVFYRRQNLSPEIRQVRVLPVGIEMQVNKPMPSEFGFADLLTRPVEKLLYPSDTAFRFRANPIPGYTTVVWNASDPNGDRLTFSVHLRHLDQDEWLPLAADLEEPFLSFNSRGLENGWYRAQVTATETRKAGESRQAKATTDPFLVDFEAPAIERADTAEAGLTFAARDEFSRIVAAVYSVNGGESVRLVPVDGIFDEPAEVFQIPAETAGAVYVEVADEQGNRSVRFFELTE